MRSSFPDGWCQQPLGSLLREVQLRVSDLSLGEQTALEVLSLTKQHGLIPQSERFEKRIATEDVRKYKVVRPGWIVYNPYVIWEGAIHSLKRTTAGIVSPVYPVLERTEDDGGYLDYLLRTPSAIEAFSRLCSGAVNRRRSIKVADFLRVSFWMPPLDEQRAIARVLNTVQAAQAATECVISAVRDLKSSLLRHLFTYGPVPFDQADKVPLKETEIGSMPEHWNAKPLGQLATFRTGTTPSTNRPSYYQGPIPFVKTAQIANNRIRAADHYISEEAKREYNLTLFPKGTVLLAMYGQGKTRGQAALLEIEATTTQNSAAILPCEDLLPTYLWHYLMGQYDRLRGDGMHGQISHLNLGYLRSFLIALPPRAIQEQVVSSLDAVEARIVAEEARQQALDSLFQTLLHDLMTGKVRIDRQPRIEGVSP